MQPTLQTYPRLEMINPQTFFIPWFPQGGHLDGKSHHMSLLSQRLVQAYGHKGRAGKKGGGQKRHVEFGD